jgi:hypothetical protein
MKLHDFFAAFLLIAGALSCAAQDRGYWRAASYDAATITGDVTIGETKLSINFVNFALAPIRSLKPVEVSAVFDADVNAGINGQLYRIHIPAATRFMHRNTLCGAEDTEWMATYVVGHNLYVAFFSGTTAPVFTVDAMANSPDRCGNFTYAR